MLRKIREGFAGRRGRPFFVFVRTRPRRGLVAALVASQPARPVIPPYHLLLWGPIMSDKLHRATASLLTLNDKPDERMREPYQMTTLDSVLFSILASNDVISTVVS